MRSSLGRLESVNVGAARTTRWRGRDVVSAIWKEPVDGPQRVDERTIVGDEQVFRAAQRDPGKALSAYAVADYAWWEAELGRALAPATFGENLTVDGPDVTDAVVGERWQIGTVTLVVSEPRIPCHKLGMRMEDPAFPRRFAAAGRPGAFLAVDEPGVLSAGDEIRLVDRPDHGVTVGDVERALRPDAGRADDVIACDDVPERLRERIRRRTERSD